MPHDVKGTWRRWCSHSCAHLCFWGSASVNSFWLRTASMSWACCSSPTLITSDEKILQTTYQQREARVLCNRPRERDCGTENGPFSSHGPSSSVLTDPPFSLPPPVSPPHPSAPRLPPNPTFFSPHEAEGTGLSLALNIIPTSPHAHFVNLNRVGAQQCRAFQVKDSCPHGELLILNGKFSIWVRPEAQWLTRSKHSANGSCHRFHFSGPWFWIGLNDWAGRIDLKKGGAETQPW